jgi:bifunctional DNase/RNase
MIEMELTGVRVELPTNQPIVLLRERGGERYLPIWIGAAEAAAIALSLQGVVTPRPMTHDLLKNILEDLTVEVQRIVVTEVRGVLATVRCDRAGGSDGGPDLRGGRRPRRSIHPDPWRRG